MLNLSLTRRFWKILSTTWLWKISMWPLNYQHILASVRRNVLTKWVASNKCCGTFFVYWFGQVHQSITASKENVVAFFQFEYAEFSGYVHFFRFRLQIPFLGKFGPKNRNCQFILIFGTSTNSNILNSMIVFNFSAFLLELPYLGKFGPTNQNCPFKLKFCT